MKLGGYLRRKFCVPVVVDYTEPQISNFVIEYLRDDEKVCKPVLAYLFGAPVLSVAGRHILGGSGSGSPVPTPALTKLGRLQPKKAAPAPYTNIVHFELLKVS